MGPSWWGGEVEVAKDRVDQFTFNLSSFVPFFPPYFFLSIILHFSPLVKKQTNNKTYLTCREV